MGLILDLIPDPPAVLWSFTTQASSVDFYIQPDYIVRPLTWTLDFGVRNSDNVVPDGTIEHIPSYVSAHPGRNRENATGSGGSYYVLLSGVTFSVPELVDREFDDLDTAPYSIAAVTTLDTRGFISFNQINLTVFNQRSIEHEYTVTIDWGDGTSTTDSPPPAPDSLNTTDLADWTYPHTYATPGIYVITVTTTAAGVTPGEALDGVALYWMITPVSPALTYGCTIDWGDASTDTYTETAIGNPEVDDNILSAVHAYEDPGPHTISITATQGRWTPSFQDGTPSDVTAIGPMACGFRLGVDLQETFAGLGQNVFLGTTIDPGFSIDNAAFLIRTFDDSYIYCYSKDYPVAPAYPFKLPRYRDGVNILTGRESYITYDLASSMADCPLLQSSSYEYDHVTYRDIYANLDQNFNLAPDDTFDRLLALWDASGCSAGLVNGLGVIKSAAAWQHYQSLLGNGWVFDDTPYENLGFYLSIRDQDGLPHTHPAYEHELWIDPIAGGYALKFTIHRTPWLNPDSPSTATVDWVMTRTTWTRTLVGSVYTFTPGSPATLGSGTATFSPSQTSQLITVNHVGTLNPLNTCSSSVRDNIAITLSNAVGESLGSATREDSLVLGGPAGVTDFNAQAGIWLDEINVRITPIAGGIDLKFVIYRAPVLNPATPGTASIQWSLQKKNLTLNSSWASTPAWTTIGSGTETFTASQNLRIVDTQYLGAYTSYVNDNTACTAFRLELHTPVNERLGTSTLQFIVA